jgi:hypothetical protein
MKEDAKMMIKIKINDQEQEFGMILILLLDLDHGRYWRSDCKISHHKQNSDTALACFVGQPRH